MSKRTVYARHDDKAALFKAAVRRAIKRYTIQREALAAVTTEDLEESLLAIARLRIANISTPLGIKLLRVLSAQAYRFPELYLEFFEEGAGPTLKFLDDLFARHMRSGEIEISHPELAGATFLSVAISAPTRLIVSGNPLKEEEIATRIQFGVHVFLKGVQKSSL